MKGNRIKYVLMIKIKFKIVLKLFIKVTKKKRKQNHDPSRLNNK